MFGYSLEPSCRASARSSRATPFVTVDERCELRCRKDASSRERMGVGVDVVLAHRAAPQPGCGSCLVETAAAEEPRLMRDVEPAELRSDDASHREAEFGDVGRCDVDRIGRRARRDDPVAECGDPFGRPGALEWQDRRSAVSARRSRRETPLRRRDRDPRSRGCDRRTTRSAPRVGPRSRPAREQRELGARRAHGEGLAERLAPRPLDGRSRSGPDPQRAREPGGRANDAEDRRAAGGMTERSTAAKRRPDRSNSSRDPGPADSTSGSVSRDAQAIMNASRSRISSSAARQAQSRRCRHRRAHCSSRSRSTRSPRGTRPR